jgi:hypothetical protein
MMPVGSTWEAGRSGDKSRSDGSTVCGEAAQKGESYSDVYCGSYERSRP